MIPFPGLSRRIYFLGEPARPSAAGRQLILFPAIAVPKPKPVQRIHIKIRRIPERYKGTAEYNEERRELETRLGWRK